jgi:hypothetical protein
MTLKEQADDHKGFIDINKNKIEKLSSRLSTFTSSFSDKLKEMNTTFEAKTNLINDTMASETESVSLQFDKTKTLCKELIDLNK